MSEAGGCYAWDSVHRSTYHHYHYCWWMVKNSLIFHDDIKCITLQLMDGQLFMLGPIMHVLWQLFILCKKLRGRKVSQFIGFYHNVGKTFTDLLLISMITTFWVYIGTQNGTYKINRENFCGLSKIRENHKGFLPHRFCCLRCMLMSSGSAIIMISSSVYLYGFTVMCNDS